MDRQNNQNAKDEKVVVNLDISIIALNINGLNLLIKRHTQ